MRRLWRKLIWLVIALLILAAVLYRFRGAAILGEFNWHKLAVALAGANLPQLVFATISIYVSYAVRSLRWKRFSRYMGRPTFWNVYGATIMGFTAVFILGRAGEPVRPLLIARKDHLPVADSFGVYVLERVFDIGATAVIAICALLAIPREVLPGSEPAPLIHDARIAGWTLLALLIVLIAFLIYFRLHGARFLDSLLSGMNSAAGWRARLLNLIRGFSEGLLAIRSWSDLLLSLVYSAIHWLIIAFVYLWVIHSLGGGLAELDFRAALLVLAFTMVGSVMQLPAVGGGTQLATFLVLTVLLGVEKEPAAAVAIVMWLVTFAAACIGGIPMLIREGWSMGELRQLAREESEAEKHGEHISPGGSGSI
ncbi:MAG TPA: lysylphosphatidylglycerol synthase transmembrane domain-containing protein [Candidatus Acidoferrales bacterium]|nr:lysylphosphatidylglycerol synthase transmembrane domain-containing protein [Candidatus Acidoferrales bacterium]